MKKKTKSFTLNFIHVPHPSGKSSQEVAVGVFHDFCILKALRNNNYKLTITKVEYIEKVMMKEIGIYGFDDYVEPITVTNNKDSTIEEIISLQSGQASLSISTAKRQAKILQNYIGMVEAYKPFSFETAVIHEYAIHGNVTVVAEKLNEQGYRIDNRSIRTRDVSSVLMKAPLDDLHTIVSSQFRKNKGI